MWATLMGVLHAVCSLVFVIAAFAWTIFPEALQVLLCGVSLLELVLLPFDLRLTLSLPHL